jgi:hypothetical protein
MADAQIRKPVLKRQNAIRITNTSTTSKKVAIDTNETSEKIPHVDFNLADECKCAECVSSSKIDEDIKMTCKLFIV